VGFDGRCPGMTVSRRRGGFGRITANQKLARLGGRSFPVSSLPTIDPEGLATPAKPLLNGWTPLEAVVLNESPVEDKMLL
jgi:hypothetical protein